MPASASSARSVSLRASQLPLQLRTQSGTGGDTGSVFSAAASARRRHRAAGRDKQAAHHDYAEHPSLAHEAMLHERPFLVPAQHSRDDVVALERAQVAPELCHRIADDGPRTQPQRNAGRAGAQHEVHAGDVGQGQVAAVVDVPVEIEIVRQHRHAQHGRVQHAGARAPAHRQQHPDQSKPEIHRTAHSMTVGAYGGACARPYGRHAGHKPCTTPEEAFSRSRGISDMAPIVKSGRNGHLAATAPGLPPWRGSDLPRFIRAKHPPPGRGQHRIHPCRPTS